MTFPRLTETAKYPLDSFDRCQLCGKVAKSIGELQMWYELDDNDKPEDPPRVLVICKIKEYDDAEEKVEQCYDELDAHPRAYALVQWMGGAPGHFIQLCGHCEFRNGASCTHPDLKQNGGDGLVFNGHRHPLAGTHVSFHNPNPDAESIGEGLTGCYPFPDTVFDKCEGFKRK